MLAGGDAGDGQSVGWVGLAGAAEPAAFPDRQRTRHLAHVQAGISEQAGHAGAEVGRTLTADALNRAVLAQPGDQPPVVGPGLREHCPYTDLRPITADMAVDLRLWWSAEYARDRC
jgi:hypothetical protein